MERFQDDRTPEQMTTHTVLIGGNDSFMSGWGTCQGGTSYAFWACKPEDADAVERWVRSRSDMRYVRTIGASALRRYRALSAPNHCHVYVVTPGHRALEATA